MIGLCVVVALVELLGVNKGSLVRGGVVLGAVVVVERSVQTLSATIVGETWGGVIGG